MNLIFYVIVLTFFFQIALKGTILLVSLYGLHLNASPFLLGVIIAAGSFLPMIFASFIGRLSDKLSPVFLITIGMIGSGFSLSLIFFLDDSISVLFLAQLVFGFFQITTVVSSQKIIGVLSSEANRAKNYASYTLSVSIANLFGPLLVGFIIDYFDYSMAYLVLSLFAFLPGLCFSFIPKYSSTASTHTQPEEKSFQELLFSPQLRTVFVTSGVILTGVGLFEFYFPIYAKSLSISAASIGFLVSLNGLAFILSRVLMRSLLKRFKPEQIMSGSFLLAGTAFFLLPFLESFAALASISFVMGLGLGACQPLSIGMAYDYSPKGQTGEVLGIRLTINKAVQFSIPIVFGSLSFLGFFLIFWFNSALLISSGYSLMKKFKIS